jgi:hypothetical protein
LFVCFFPRSKRAEKRKGNSMHRRDLHFFPRMFSIRLDFDFPHPSPLSCFIGS